jgi:hypothetical protein
VLLANYIGKKISQKFLEKEKIVINDSCQNEMLIMQAVVRERSRNKEEKRNR